MSHYLVLYERVKGILALSPELLGVSTKILGAPNNSRGSDGFILAKLKIWANNFFVPRDLLIFSPLFLHYLNFSEVK